MADIIMRFIADPRDALQASKEVSDQLDEMGNNAQKAQGALPGLTANTQAANSEIFKMNEASRLAEQALNEFGITGTTASVIMNTLQRSLMAMSGAQAAATRTTATQTAALKSKAAAALAAAGATAIGAKATAEADIRGTHYVTMLRAKTSALLQAAGAERTLANIQKYRAAAVEEIGTREQWIQRNLNATTVATKGLTAATAGLATWAFPILIGAVIAGAWAWNKYKQSQEDAKKAAKEWTESQLRLQGVIRSSVMDYLQLTNTVEYQKQSFINARRATTEAAMKEYKKQIELLDDEFQRKRNSLRWKHELMSQDLRVGGVYWKKLQELNKQHEEARQRAKDEANRAIEQATKTHMEQLRQLEEQQAADAAAADLVRAEQIKQLYETAEFALRTFGMTEAGIMQERLKDLGAEADEIERIVGLVQERLDLQEALKDTAKEELETHQKMQMIGLTQMYRRIQEASATPPRTVDKDTLLQERQLDEQMKQTELLREMERRLPSVGVLN